MYATQECDELLGYKAIDTQRKNLVGAIDQIHAMKYYKIDITHIENKLDELDSQFDKINKHLENNKMPFPEMQKDSEGFVLGNLVNAYKDLNLEYQRDIEPLYKIYTLFTEIDDNIYLAGDVSRLTELTIMLIDHINSIDTHNNTETISLINKAYETIFNAMQYEAIYNKDDIINYINSKNLDSNRENLGVIIRKNIDKVNKDVLIDDKIKHIDEGAGYDYVSKDIIKELSKENLSYIYKEIEETNKEKVDELTDKYAKVNMTIEQLEDKKESYSDKIKSISTRLLAARALIASYIAVPTIMVSTGCAIGVNTSNKIDEYATVTREINLETRQVLSEEKVYTDVKTSYVASITVYEPWKENPYGSGYIRDAIVYEYNNEESNHNITKEDVELNSKEKFRYSEVKEVLDENDSLTNATIIVTETYQNKQDSIKSKKYVVPAVLISAFLSLVTELVLVMFSMETVIENLREKEARKENKEYLANLERKLIELTTQKSILEDEINKLTNNKTRELRK